MTLNVKTFHKLIQLNSEPDLIYYTKVLFRITSQVVSSTTISTYQHVTTSGSTNKLYTKAYLQIKYILFYVLKYVVYSLMKWY